MADLKRQAGFVGKLLEFDFEQLYGKRSSAALL
jgi:hypothetical protein